MGCDAFEYEAIFDVFGRLLRQILTEEGGIPYPLFETRDAYDESEASYKGLLVWNAQKYFAGLKTTTEEGEYTPDVGFYVIPEFGDVNIIPNIEFRQAVALLFDSNSDPDVDPFGLKIIKFINWFLNELSAEVNQNELYLPDTGQRLYVHVSTISKPIYNSGRSLFVRRVVTIYLRYCRAGA